MTLPEDDEAVFDLFVNWLYHHRFPDKINDVGKDGDMLKRRIQLYVLADKYDVCNLRSLVISQIFRIFKEGRPIRSLSMITYAYKHTSQNAAIRKMIVDFMACSWPPSWFQYEHIKEWLQAHPDISTDLIVSFAKHKVVQKNSFDGEMPKEYLENEGESGK